MHSHFLAVFLQHTDNKPEQQVILCLGQGRALATDSCKRPFLMISDVGLTFGRANRSNGNDSGVNLIAWQRTPVWKDEAGCTGNLPKSFTGTLDNPMISEDGRHFLAHSHATIRIVRFGISSRWRELELRLRSPGDVRSGFATIDEWVDTFKQKRDQIVSRRCA